ncbi:1,4-alpha-glucan branching protein [Niastella koreensis]|uniref:1,4-alpha-glucan branching enzyme n=3 Tax=Niastella koreensis TaxID=354356 RepID=G8TF44_NIAKG|nr:maltooligosyl trehalose hydrolase [Niastella koreensis GR20-10]OQP55707.1 1,4-alpha-glucan branching protein [Niastella koreensis]
MSKSTTAAAPEIHIEGMGSIPHENGVFFRVWAPHAKKVFVTGEFNNWSKNKHPMTHEGNGYWGLNIPDAKAGNQYKYILQTDMGLLHRNDPYARELTNSAGNSIITDPHFEWTDHDFKMPSWNELVIYEMHIGTFNVKEDGKPGTFETARQRLGYLKALGVNALEIMPATEFPGGISWGYNLSHPYAIESDYGGVKGFKELINAAHELGIAIILDVVYNHFGPSDLDLWQFDGWSENGAGGIYFYQDWRAETPWGHTRPDYGRPEVRQYLRDNALMWLEDYHIDGLRTDALLFVRNAQGKNLPEADLPEGWTLMKWINEEVKKRFPWKITIAEDLQDNEWITKGTEDNGEGFNTQWDPAFTFSVRDVLKVPEDEHRDLDKIQFAINHNFNGDAFQRVIYTESHDDVANGKTRVPEEITPGDAQSWFAKKRSVLGAVLVFTAAGIPMIFQGQEFVEGGWFDDTRPLDWSKFSDFKGIARLYRDCISLRRNMEGLTKGLSGQHTRIIHVNNEDKVIAFHRWYEGGPKDSTIVVLNFMNKEHKDYVIGVPEEGVWKVRFNSDWKGYDESFTDAAVFDVETFTSSKDEQEFSISLNMGPYNALILSRD